MDRRQWMIGGAIGLTVLALIALATGLSSLSLGTGKPLPRLDPFQSAASPDLSEQSGTGVATILQVFLSVVFWILLPLSIVLIVVSAEARRRLLRNIAAVASVMLFLYLIIRVLDRLDIGPADRSDAGGPPGSGAGATRSVEPPDFVSHPPDWMVLVVSGAIFAVIGFLAWRFWQRRAADRAADASLEDELAQEAESALDAIQSGQDLSNVVLRCYRDMERAVQRAHGLNRRASMTPREFERRLVNSGLDAEAVGRLTRLFERARYGSQAIDAEDEADAESCLVAIAGRTSVGEPA